MIARRLGTLLTLVVLVTSGTYLLVYLYRWEWNRALVSGLFFVAAEVALVATALLRRLHRIEARLDAGGPLSAFAPPATTRPASSTDPYLARIRETAPEPERPFRWLDPTQLNVFVPVLLGAGVVLSVLAHGVERLAGATATPVLERRLADRLAPLAVPPGGLLLDGVAPSSGPPGHRPERPRHTVARSIRRVFAVVVSVFALVVAIDLMADATQNRPDPRLPGLASEVTFTVRHRDAGRSVVRTAEGLWAACRNAASKHSDAMALDEIGPGRVRLTVTPALGKHAQRRFVGCLEDATLDRVQAEVVDLRAVPAR